MSERLRIVLPIHSFEPGGVERVALKLAARWHADGHEVAVLLGRDGGLDRNSAPGHLDYRLRRFPVSTARFESLWMVWCLVLHLRKHPADIVFCAGNTYAWACLIAKILLRGRCPPVLVKVSNDLVRRDKSPVRRRVYGLWLGLYGAMLERFVALAEPMQEEIAAHMGVGLHRIATIHDPALCGEQFGRLVAIPRTAIIGRPRRFLAIGRLVSQKNVSMLLRAFAAGFRPGDTLTIVGAGPHSSDLDQLACQLAIERNVIFTGHVPAPDPYLRDADCLLLSSNYEGVPAVVIEAIAAGLPIIATDCCASMRTLLDGGARGRLIPVGDVDAMAKAIAHSEALPVLSLADRHYAARYTLDEAVTRYVHEMRVTISTSSP